MSYVSCWSRLGIAHTTDVGAIRRAYAARLKALDVDSDVDGFQALRDARDEAMYLATQPAWDDVDEDPLLADAFDPGDPVPPADDAILWGVGDIAAELDAEATRAAPAPEPEQPATIDVVDAPYHALYDLLDPDTSDRIRHFPAGDEAAEIRAAFDAILLDPRMEQIEFYAHQEGWLATVIALSWPMSEPLVEPAVAYFRWEEHAGEIGQDEHADFAVQRLRAVRFAAQVRNPRHRFFDEWRELTKPATERSRRNWFVRAQPVNELLGMIRAQYPTLERELDPYRVALWDRPGRVATDKRQLVITIGIILLINVLVRMPWRDEPAPSSPAMTAPAEMTLAWAVHESIVGGQITVDDIRSQNPDLHARLVAQFALAKEQQLGPRAMIGEIDRIIRDQVTAALRNPPYPLLEPQARLLVAHAREARHAAGGAEDCVSVLFGGGRPPPLSQRLMATAADLRARAALAPIASAQPARPGTRTGRLDPDIASLIAKRSGLAGQRLGDALMNRGDADARCTARIAAIEVALGLPQSRGEPLLRTLVT